MTSAELTYELIAIATVAGSMSPRSAGYSYLQARFRVLLKLYWIQTGQDWKHDANPKEQARLLGAKGLR